MIVFKEWLKDCNEEPTGDEENECGQDHEVTGLPDIIHPTISKTFSDIGFFHKASLIGVGAAKPDTQRTCKCGFGVPRIGAVMFFPV